MEGLVLKSTGKWYIVKGDDGKEYPCQIRGKLRLKGTVTTNPVAAGDKVRFDVDVTGEEGNIMEVHERSNYIIRRSVNLSREAQIVASNIDQVFLVVTTTQPQTTFGFTDRFLVTAEAYRIPAILLFHKIDQYDEAELEYVAAYMDVYRKAGYRCMVSSLVTGEGFGELETMLKDKVSLFSGHSGTGKSSIVNHFIPGLDLRTGDISHASGKGQHTTTFAEMHPLPFGGYIVDTPGIKGFGLVDIPKEELHHYFPEFFALLPECRFSNCKHINEPGCAVIRAIEEGTVSPTRYDSYVSMWNDNEERSPYR